MQSTKLQNVKGSVECRVKALEASLNWWEGKDRGKKCAAERRKQEDKETRDKVRRDLVKKRKLDDS